MPGGLYRAMLSSSRRCNEISGLAGAKAHLPGKPFRAQDRAACGLQSENQMSPEAFHYRAKWTEGSS